MQPTGPAGLRWDFAAKNRLFGAAKTLPASSSAGKASGAGAVGPSRLMDLAQGQDLGCGSCALPCPGVSLGSGCCCCGSAPPRPHFPVGAQRLLQTAPSPACKANTYVAQSGFTAPAACRSCLGRRERAQPGQGRGKNPFSSLSGSSGAAHSGLWDWDGPLGPLEVCAVPPGSAQHPSPRGGRGASGAGQHPSR